MASLQCLWFWITDHATVLSVVATAIATLMIGIFTAFVAKATCTQAKSIRVLERGYIAASFGEIERTETDWAIFIRLVNVGRAPVDVDMILVQFDDRDGPR